MDIEKRQSEFVDNIALRSAINAATQTRSEKFHVYSNLICENRTDSAEVKKQKNKKKKEIVAAWKIMLKEFAVRYQEKRDDQYFFIDVQRFQEEMNSKKGSDGELLKEGFEGGSIRIAQCQKSLSVYLKWLWCLGILKHEPPVCPIDRNVLSSCYKKLDRKNGQKYRKLIIDTNKAGGWGQINDMNEYKKLVKVTQILSEREGMTPAEWELGLFNDVLEDNL